MHVISPALSSMKIIKGVKPKSSSLMQKILFFFFFFIVDQYEDGGCSLNL